MSSGTENIISEESTYEEVKEFIWEIPDFYQIQLDQPRLTQQAIEIKVGKYAETQSRWQIGLQIPSNGSSMFGAAFKLLKIPETEKSVLAKINVELVKLDGSSLKPQTLEKQFSENQEIVTEETFLFTCFDNQENYVRYLNTDGALQLKIELSVFYKNPNLKSVVTSLKMDSAANLHQALANSMSGNFNSDVKIICNDGQEFNVHKSILSANSDVFESMFSPQSDFAENRTGVIKVDDLSGKTMDILLTYIYTLELKSSWNHSDTIVEFVYAAGKYQLKELLAILDDTLGLENGSACNMTLLNLVYKLQLKNAEKRLMARIVKLANTAKNSEDLFTIFGTGDHVGNEHLDK